MPKALFFGLLLHCGVSFGLSLLGVVRLVSANAILSILGLAMVGAVAWGLFKLALPYWARTGRPRDEVMVQALGTAGAGQYAVFLVLVGLARKSGLEADWILTAFEFGALFALMTGVIWSYESHTRNKEIRHHAAAVSEARRLMELDLPKEAEDKLKESLLSGEVMFGSKHLHCAQTATDLARFYVESDQRPRAAAMFRRALKIRENLLGADDVLVSSALMEWVGADDSLEPGEAISQLHKALLILEKQLGATAPPVALAYERVGELHLIQQRYREAEEALRRSFYILRKVDSQTQRDQFRVGLRLVRCYIDMARIKDAQETLDSLRELLNTQRPQMHLEYLMVEMRLATASGNQSLVQDKAWACLQLMQRELGPSASEFKAIWEACLPRLSEPYLDPDAQKVLGGILSGDTFTTKQAIQAHPEWLNTPDGSGWTFAQWAAFFGQERVLDNFLAMGASADEVKDEWPLLHIACRWGHRRIISSLSTKVASQNQRAKEGWYPIHRCAQNGDNRLVECLAAKDLDVDVINERGETPLLIACRNGHYNFVVTLLGRGADVNKVNANSGRTPLHEAAYIGHRAIADCLMLNSARLEARDRAGLTPAELASQADREGIARQIQAFSRWKT